MGATLDLSQAMQLELAYQVTTDGKATVRVRGELDIATADQAYAYLRDVVDNQDGPVTMNLAELTFCDAAGLGVLARVAGYARRTGHSLKLTAARPSLLRIMHITGMDEAFPEVRNPSLAMIAWPRQATRQPGLTSPRALGRAGGHDRDGAMRMTEHGMLDRAVVRRAMPADNHQVGARGQVRQDARRVAAHDILADADLRVFLLPAALARPQAAVPWRPPIRCGLRGREVRPAQRGLLEREPERVVGAAGIAHADHDLTVHGHRIHADHDRRARRARRHAPAEAPRAAGADHEQLRACPAVRHGGRGRPVQQAGVDHDPRRHLGGPLYGVGQAARGDAAQRVRHGDR